MVANVWKYARRSVNAGRATSAHREPWPVKRAAGRGLVWSGLVEFLSPVNHFVGCGSQRSKDEACSLHRDLLEIALAIAIHHFLVFLREIQSLEQLA